MKLITGTRLCAATFALLATTTAACLRAADHSYDIPAQNLGGALQTFARESGAHVVVSSDLVEGRQSQTISRVMADADALSQLLSGSGLRADLVSGAYVIRRDQSGAQTPRSSDSDIVVTGTRIHGAAPIGSPLITIDHSAIERSGRATIADYLQTLPQNYGGDQNEGTYVINPHAGGNQNYGSSIDLRGLGTTSTLVLFDGNRPALGGESGTFVDTSLIPSTAIDRVEILTDGASAIYGTDAVAGVVNVRFRDKLQGFETHLYSGVAAGGAMTQQQFAQAAGTRWETGSIMLAYQYDHRSPLPGSSRAVSTEDLRPFGGPDLRSPYSVPGTIIADDGEVFGIPSGQNGHGLTSSQLLQGVQYEEDRRRNIDLLPSQTTHSAYVAFDQKLGDKVDFYARALYAHRAFDIVFPSRPLSPVTVPTTNPFYVDPIGTGQPVQVEYDFEPEVGRYQGKGSLDAVTSSEGLRWHAKRWNLEASGEYGHQVERERDLNSLSDERIADALADTDPATALNVFGDGTANNAATLNFIRANRGEVDRYRVWSGNLRADGPLFILPTGSVRLATGYEHRDEHFTSLYHSDGPSDSPGDLTYLATAGTPGERNIDAIYAELSVPLLGPNAHHLPGKLDLSAAARADWYSDVGRTINPKVGLRWEPLPGVALRGSWGTSFRAPSFAENPGQINNDYEAFYIPDPRSPSGQTGVIAQFGYPATIDPEKATSWTAGFDLNPAFLPGVSLTATWFDIKYHDRIVELATYLDSYLVQRSAFSSLTHENPSPATVAAIYALDNFYNDDAVPVSQVGAIIDARAHNLARQTVHGIDFDLEANHKVLSGTASVGVSGSRLIKFASRIDQSAPVDDVLGTIYNPVKVRLRGHLGWSGDGFDLNVMPNYVGGYTNDAVLPFEHVKSWTTFDAQIGYTFTNASPLKGAHLALSVTNLFNRQPPYVLNSFNGSTLAFDPDQANAIGRLISVQATFKW